jgi:hypothetical protein
MLVLPDGSRSLIPASWTDLSGQKHKNSASAGGPATSNIIATTHHLLHARKIVDALLCRLNSSEQKDITSSKEERKRAQAIEIMAHIKRSLPVPRDLEDTDLSTKTRYYNRSGRPDQQNGPYRGHRSGGKS